MINSRPFSAFLSQLWIILSALCLSVQKDVSKLLESVVKKVEEIEGTEEESDEGQSVREIDR